MARSFLRRVAFALAVVLVAQQVAVVPVGAAANRTAAHGNALIRPSTIAVAANVRPRNAIPEPPHRTPMPMPSVGSMRAMVSTAIRHPAGKLVHEPPMVRPAELDHVLAELRHRGRHASMDDDAQAAPTSPAASRKIAPGRARAGTALGKPATRTVQSIQMTSGTGLNPWWHYEESSAPGDGRVLINVGTGNLLFQDDDMGIPHKGIPLSFRRTYNSQSPLSFPDTFNPWQSLYGNGWTNTFDAHLADMGPGHKTVYDVDGARYDYIPNSSGSGYVSATPGNYATLAFDGSCGFLWTKRDGTSYYFWRSAPSATTCPSLSPIGGYAGRLHQIIGRNRSAYLTLSYSWDFGDASLTGKVSAISVQAESGLTATMTFADVAGRRLLQQIVFPDGLTTPKNTVSYGYDTAGNLTSVSKPPNNAAGTSPQQTFGYQSVGADSVLYWAYSPRLNASSPLGSDGGWTGFLFSGSSAATSTVNLSARRATVNPSIDDGSSQPVLQPGYAPNPYYLYEYYTTGAPVSTLRDSDGHAKSWTIDSSGRATRTEVCTATASQACTSSSTYLDTYEAWDANNNLVSTIDPRGNETDYAYDANGNVVAVGEPATTTSDGSFKPTYLASYDGSNNVVAVCDETWTNKHGLNWTANPGGSDSLCPQTVGSPGAPGTYVFHYSPTINEPLGELAWTTTPMGYRTTYTYPTGAIDDGLPIAVSGDPFTQADGTPYQDSRTFSYDANGNVLTAAINGVGTSSYTYDSFGRRLTSTDPDQVTSYVSYWPDGSISSTETAFQHTNGTGVRFQYDLDGNQVRETHHYRDIAGDTRRWYDGADRLIEVMYPRHPDSLASLGADYSLARPDRAGGAFMWGTRYLYDLSGGQLPPGSAGPAYGGVYRIQETTADAGWQNVRGMTYDALDRELQMWDFGEDYGQTGAAQSEAYTYDGNGQLGLLSAVNKAATTETNLRTYDERGLLIRDIFFDPRGGQYTPGKLYSYDANGRGHSIQSTFPGSAYGSMTYAYDEDSRLLNKSESTDSAFDDAAGTISYSYYPNGKRRNLSVARNPGQGGFDQQNMFEYAYRPDGALAWKNIHLPAAASSIASPGAMRWTYTAAGRLLQRFDPFTGTAISGRYASAKTRGALARSFRFTPGTRRVASETPAATIAARLAHAQRPNIRAARVKSGVQPPAPLGGSRAPRGLAASPNPQIVLICPPANLPTTGGPPQPTTIVTCCTDDCPPPPTPTPTGPPPTPRPAATFAPLTVSYDGYGRVSSYLIPSGGTYNNFSYDAEGSITDFWGYADPPNGLAAKHLNNAYNIRGELTGQHAFDGSATTAFNTSWPSYSMRPYNGTMMPIRDGDNSAIAPPTVYGPKLNGKIYAVDYHVNYTSNFPSPGTVCQAIMARFTWTQDASGRDIAAGVSRIATFPDPCVNTQPGYFNGNVSKGYDFNDHLMQWDIPSGNYWPTFGSSAMCTNTAPYGGLLGVSQYGHNQYDYGWGAEGDLVQIVAPGSWTRNLHWDGNELLYVTDGLGNVESVKVSSDAETNPQNKFIVRDRDWTGAQVMTHDATGYSAWLPPNPTHAGCTPNSHPQASPSYDSPYEPAITHPTLDSYMDLINVFQGRRTYDSTSMQWSTPDANPGTLDDPVSMKAYAWNRNDPLRYGDFDGQNSIEIPVVGRVTARWVTPPFPADPWAANDSIADNSGMPGNWVMPPGWSRIAHRWEWDGYACNRHCTPSEGTIIAPSRILGIALARAGFMKSAGDAAHHIVPYAMKRFTENIVARAIMARWKVGLNEASNGTWLQGARHWGIHTERYMQSVVERMREATSGDHLREILRGIGEEIRNGTFPF